MSKEQMPFQNFGIGIENFTLTFWNLQFIPKIITKHLTGIAYLQEMFIIKSEKIE